MGIAVPPKRTPNLISRPPLLNRVSWVLPSMPAELASSSTLAVSTLLALQQQPIEPRRHLCRLRHRQRYSLLDCQEQLGHRLGRQRLHPHAPKLQQHVRCCCYSSLRYCSLNSSCRACGSLMLCTVLYVLYCLNVCLMNKSVLQILVVTYQLSSGFGIIYGII